MSDLKEALENFKSASRPFQAIIEVAAALEPFADQERDLKEARSTLAAAQSEREAAKAETAELKKKATEYTKQLNETAQAQADEIVKKAQGEAAGIVENAQKKQSAIQNDSNKLLAEKDQELDYLELLKEELENEVEALRANAVEAEKRLAAAKASISKILGE